MASIVDSPPGMQSNASAVFSDPTTFPAIFAEPIGAAVDPLPDCIPPEHPHRTLVLCFDGTGDQFDSDNSNVVEFFSMLKKEDPSRQLVYYQAGIGTYTTPEIATPTFAKFSKLMDEMIAWNLDAHIMGGYEFLMQNYRANDKICIFGFSRGAYTARCLAGMIHKVGLLPTCNHQQVPFAYKMYTQADEEGWKQSNVFKKTFSIDVDIEFVGVWDTVNSVGLFPRRLPFTTSNTVVHTFRHAVSLDERRAKFKANLWNCPDHHEQTLSISDQKAKHHIDEHSSGAVNKKRKTPHLHALERRYSQDSKIETDVEEVWFSGCHCVENGAKPCLARIPLRWMVRECFKTKSGILFHTDGLRAIGLDPASLYPVVLERPPAVELDTAKSETSLIQSIPKGPRPPVHSSTPATSLKGAVESEEVADLKDALAPIYDQLSMHWFWWLLELLPLKHRSQNHDYSWTWWLGWNWGEGRHVGHHKLQHLKVHRSVKTRMTAEDAHGRKYTPKAFKNFTDVDLERITWVD
ncbi:hypothetical protein NLJ89_g6184 [Agrocybe chaxingu]|uniref:T6SS Phospholipase effector Tle1-like catalytic domain-containing protein n=1 Tax=Agrocybe chaxingu TaxID=84603 RepID=A0A9W8K6X0_9AGAR|nr:hypothetical protein NLJ89_g6184 [Agrocybe chaxingu]